MHVTAVQVVVVTVGGDGLMTLQHFQGIVRGGQDLNVYVEGVRAGGMPAAEVWTGSVGNVLAATASVVSTSSSLTSARQFGIIHLR
ncbi:hypothetical protein [Paenarthrobacter nicotinovorans]|uniref:hypothetical protein n=1 Tax=Paenarthrobacter nicotinovorans TaxID=29320 RepID=UPI003A7FD3D4